MPRSHRLAAILLAVCTIGAPQLAVAQNPTGMLPFPPSSPFPPGMLQPPPTLRPPVTGGSGSGHGGHHHPHRPFIPFVYNPYFFGDSATAAVQPEPVNPEPFAPTTPPAFGQQESTKPYKPPSVEIAPGGIEIVRGPS